MEEKKECKTCTWYDNGFCDRVGKLAEEDDTCEGWEDVKK